MRHLQAALLAFELQLNPKKTRIYEAPVPLEDDWLPAVKQFGFRERPRAQATDLAAYFDLLARYALAHPSASVFSYGLTRFRNEAIHEENCDLLISLILQALVAEPSSAKIVSELLSALTDQGIALPLARMRPLFSDFVSHHSSLGHAWEVCWALSMCINHGIGLNRAASLALGRSDDALVTLMALHARHEGLIKSFTSKLMATPQAVALDGPYWLLAYESRAQGWTRRKWTSTNDQVIALFEDCAKQRVSFYDLELRTTTRTKLAFSYT